MAKKKKLKSWLKNTCIVNHFTEEIPFDCNLTVTNCNILVVKKFYLL
jgi:hypothetical protein